MNIALDYDHTFTKDPKFWLRFIDLAHAHGHHVYCVTMRAERPAQSMEVLQALHGKVRNIVFTDYKAKRKYVDGMGLHIDVWIDDMPETVGADVAPWPDPVQQ